mmetsp:Transcript_22885/g.38330  ORF Transcript_22885/g.38330 Transcript_22885/m.38330 type:complete len:325 (+) Transcript_22885:1641-2615(+)
MCLCNVTGATHNGGIARLLELPGFGAVAHHMACIVAGDLAHKRFGNAVFLGLKRRNGKADIDLDPGVGMHRLHARLNLGHVIQICLFQRFGIVPGHRAKIHREPAILGGDVVRRPARYLPHMPCGIGRIEHRAQSRRLGCKDLCVALVGKVDDLYSFENGADARVQKRGMYLKADHMGVKALPALVACHGLHHRRLAHDHRPALGHHAVHRLDHRWRAQTADFLVIAKGQLQRFGHACIMRLNQRPEGQRVKAFHVAGPAPKIFAIPRGHDKRVCIPGLAIHRHHIRVTRQHHRPFDFWPHMGKERGLGLVGMHIAMCGDPVPI